MGRLRVRDRVFWGDLVVGVEGYSETLRHGRPGLAQGDFLA